MIGKIFFLAALALTMARPSDESAETSDRKTLREPSSLCPRTNSYWLLPHERDCSKFYCCEYGMKYIDPRNCANGTVFSSEAQVWNSPGRYTCVNQCGEKIKTCVHSRDYNCQLPTTTTAAPPTAPPTQTTTHAPSVVLPNGCPANWHIHHLLPHAECNKFYQCVFGKPVERQCAPGTYFNYKIQVCDWPENVECANGGGGSGDGECGDNGGGDGGVAILPNGCPSDWNIHHLLPHEVECNKFYQCVFGEKVEKICAPGTHFNPAIQVCVHISEYDCKLPGITTTVAPTVAPTQATTSAPSGVLPNGCPANWNIHHLLPHETDCNKFYQCVFGEKVEKLCAPGTHFNPAIQVCDWPANAGCIIGGGDNGGGDNGGNCNDKCKNQCNILPWAHDTDCDKFWRCVGEVSVLGVCSEGLHFNSNSLTCDFICNAGCVRGKAQATMSDEGIKLFLPWDKVDSDMERLIELSTNQEIHKENLDD